MNFANPLVYAAPCFIALILLEISYSRTHNNKSLYNWKDLGASLTFGIATAIIDPLIKTFSLVMVFHYTYEFFNPLVDGIRMNIMGWESFGYAWYIWLICQILDDLTYYWYHRYNHTVRIFWAAHIVHHSSNHFNLGTAVRNGFFTVLYKPLFYMWLPAIGFPPAMVVLCLAIESLWQFQLHSKYIPKMGWVEKIFNTHTMHQVHHSKNIEYMDKNHGGFLNIFDKVFGSWKELDDTIEADFGVTHEPNSYNPWIILTHEFKDIWNDTKKSKNWYHKFMYTFGPPGWSHDNSTQTVKQMQLAIKQKKV